MTCLTPLFFAHFCFNALSQFTPLHNMLSLFFRFNAIWLVYLHLFKHFFAYGDVIFLFAPFLFTPTFQERN